MDQVEEIKEKIDIVEFINERVPLKKAGRNYKALCPFHQEKTPSFFVNPQRQIWYCFGACDEGGDVISFLQKWDNLEFVEALRELSEETGVKLQFSGQGSEKSKLKTKLYEINHLAGEYFHYLLTEHKIGSSARDYLSERKIKGDTIETFKLGYAPDSWGGLINFLKSKKHTPELMEKAGLVIKSSSGSGYYDRFRGRVIFPLFNHRKKPVGFSGRTLGKEKEAKYINTPETLIYHKRKMFYGLDRTGRAIQRENAAIVAEGEFDVLSSYQLGVTNIVAVKGSGLSEDQVRLLKRYTDKIVFALDSDQAGEEAIRRGVLLADEAGLDVRVVPLSGGKDPDELIRNAPSRWRELIKKPKVYFDYLIAATAKRFDTETAHGKREAIEDLAPFFARSNNPIIKDHYQKLLSEKLGLSQSSVATAIATAERELRRGYSRPSRKREEKRDKRKKLQRWQLLSEYLLSLILQSKSPRASLEKLEENLPLVELPESAAQKILLQLNKQEGEEKDKFDAAAFIGSLKKELVDTADRSFIRDLRELTKDEELLQKELLSAAKELKLVVLRRELSETTTKLKEKEAEGKHGEEIKKLNQKAAELTQQIRKLT